MKCEAKNFKVCLSQHLLMKLRRKKKCLTEIKRKEKNLNEAKCGRCFAFHILAS